MRALAFLALFLSLAPLHADPRVIDLFSGCDYWTGLSSNAKRDYLASRPYESSSCGIQGPLRWPASQIPALTSLLDAFYKTPSHRDILLRFATEVCLKQINGATPKEIEAATLQARHGPVSF